MKYIKSIKLSDANKVILYSPAIINIINNDERKCMGLKFGKYDTRMRIIGSDIDNLKIVKMPELILIYIDDNIVEVWDNLTLWDSRYPELYSSNNWNSFDDCESWPLINTNYIPLAGEHFYTTCTDLFTMVNDELWYKTTDNSIITPNNDNIFDINGDKLSILLNEYDEEKGICVMKFSGDVYKFGDYLFQSQGKVRRWYLPESLTIIGDETFSRGGETWTYWRFGNNVKSIGYKAFHGNIYIRNLYMPNIEIISDAAFWYAGIYNNGDTFILPNTYSKNSDGTAFFQTWGSSNIVVREGIEELPQFFYKLNNSKLYELIRKAYLPSTLKAIPKGTFGGTIIEDRLVIPVNVTTADNYTFIYSGITSVKFACNNFKAIPEGMFCYAYKLKSIELCDSIISIGDFGFYDCTSLTDIKLPNSISSVGISIFRGCTNLASVELSSSLTSIGDYMFYDCTSLSSISIPNSVMSIGYSAFNGCTNLASIELPNLLTEIGGYAFWGCSSLLNMVIPNLVTSIGTNTFRSCTNLVSIELPNSLTTIGKYAFMDCSNLLNIVIPNYVLTINNAAFYNCASLSNITIPSSVTSISTHIFTGCAQLTSIIVDENNTIYDSRNNCNGIIESATNKLINGQINITSIPEGVEIIGVNSMSGAGITNISRSEIVIPSTVTSIEKNAFDDNLVLRTIICKAINPPTLDSMSFNGDTNIEHIYVPAESVDAYKAAENWSTFASIISAIQ